MTLQEVAIVLYRLLGAMPVLRWPLAGGLLAVAVDLTDLVLVNYLHWGGVREYQALDKASDVVYMLTFLVVTRRWPSTERRIAAGLFTWRMIGVVLFEIAHQRAMLFVFPNVFEVWFLLVAVRDHFRPTWPMTRLRASIALSVLLFIKLVQEWLLHIDRRLDHYVLADVVAAIMQWLKGMR